jgi:hypothetical protein
LKAGVSLELGALDLQFSHFTSTNGSFSSDAMLRMTGINWPTPNAQ